MFWRSVVATGRMTWRYAHETASVVATDPKEERIGRAIENTPDALQSVVAFQLADITSTELSRAAFDIAIFSWSL